MSKTISEPIKKLLAQTLGLRNATFSIVRQFGGQVTHNEAAHVARKAYHVRGVAWASDEATDKGRKDAAAALDKAEAAKWIIAHKSAAKRTTGIAFTDSGERLAAGLCAGACLGDGVLIVDAIRRRADAGVIDVWEDHLIPALNATRPYVVTDDWSRVEKLALLEDMLIPWMIRGFIHGASTGSGNARYWLGDPTPAGFNPGPPADPSAIDDDAAELFITVFQRERERLKYHAPVPGNEIGPIPLCASAVSAEQLEGWKTSAAMAAKGE